MNRPKVKTEVSEVPVSNNPICFEELKTQCTFCGAKFKVVYMFQSENNTERVYYCPECSEEYSVQAAAPIVENAVELISLRMDGRSTLLHSER